MANEVITEKRGRGRPRKQKSGFGPQGMSCKELFDIVYLREDNPLYFSLHTVSPSSVCKIKAIVTNHIVPYFKPYNVNDLSIEQVSGFRKYMVRKGLSPKSATDIQNYAKSAFSMANDIDNSRVYRNPFYSKAIAPIRINSRGNRTDAFEVSDIEKLFSKPWENPLIQAFATFCAYTGARPNEVAALTPEDFSVYEEYVEISISKNWSAAEKAIRPPKTQAGNRIVILPRYVFDAIKINLYWENGSPVFSVKGKHLYYRYYSKYLNLAIKSNGVQSRGRDLVMYSFRPFYKSYTTDKLSPELSNYVMGHSEKSIGDRYWHYQRDLHALILVDAVKDLVIANL